MLQHLVMVRRNTRKKDVEEEDRVNWTWRGVQGGKELGELGSEWGE